MVSVQDPLRIVHFSSEVLADLGESRPSVEPFDPTPEQEAWNAGYSLAYSGEDPAIPAGPIGVAFGEGVHAGRMELVRERDEIFAGWEREREFEAWVESMEAAYGHLPNGPSFDDERSGDVGRSLSLPYE